jgi:cytochrome P450 family 2 subfamily U polypeptide 1
MNSIGRSIPIIEMHLRKAIQEIRDKNEKGFEIRWILSFQAFSVIADMSVGRIAMSPTIMKEFLQISEDVQSYFLAYHLRNIIPGYRYLPIKDKCSKLIQRRDEILHGVIEEHRKTLDRENPKDFLDHLLIDEENGELYVSILHLLVDTFIGGSDTSSHTLEILISHLANNPSIQKKVHDEIDSVVKGREPTLEDEENLPYLCAALKEAMRISPVGGILMRMAGEDFHLRGYTIPKDTQILIMSHCITNDPSLWSDPHVFSPDRFINEENEITIRGGEMPKNRDHLKASFFGVGKRSCAGYQLARKELFLQATYYLWAFEFSPASDEKLDMTILGGLGGKLKHPANLIAKYRHTLS